MLNVVQLQGRLVDDPSKVFIMHTAKGDRAKYTFTVASQDDLGKQPTYFIPCAAWGKTGDFISKWFHKGHMIFLTGKLTSYRDYSDGEGNTKIELLIERADFPSEKKMELAEAMEDVPPVELDEEDLPF